MTTATQIREKALKKLGVKATGQGTQSEIQADVDQAYAEVYAMLGSLTIWDIDEEIPDAFVSSVVALVADARKNTYSIPNDRYQRITLDARGDGTHVNPGALQNIKTMQASNVYKTPEAEYF